MPADQPTQPSVHPPSAPTPGDAGPRILILLAHPDLHGSRVNRRLIAAARDAGLGPRLTVRDLYALYPDYAIDVPTEQAALAQADLIIWQHPIQWYSMPALMKLWIDEVFALGWAYGGGRALAGKDLWLVASTGGQQAAYHPSGYNRYFFDAFLPPYEQTATLCGLRFLPPLLLHGAHTLSEAALADHAARYTSALQRYPNWPELADLAPCRACELPITDRPR